VRREKWWSEAKGEGIRVEGEIRLVKESSVLQSCWLSPSQDEYMRWLSMKLTFWAVRTGRAGRRARTGGQLEHPLEENDRG
jgi:hypothetical protein